MRRETTCRNAMTRADSERAAIAHRADVRPSRKTEWAIRRATRRAVRAAAPRVVRRAVRRVVLEADHRAAKKTLAARSARGAKTSSRQGRARARTAKAASTGM